MLHTPRVPRLSPGTKDEGRSDRRQRPCTCVLDTQAPRIQKNLRYRDGDTKRQPTRRAPGPPRTNARAPPTAKERRQRRQAAGRRLPALAASLCWLSARRRRPPPCLVLQEVAAPRRGRGGGARLPARAASSPSLRAGLARSSAAASVPAEWAAALHPVSRYRRCFGILGASVSQVAVAGTLTSVAPTFVFRTRA